MQGKSFLGTWNLIVPSCKYDDGPIPVEATHTFAKSADGHNVHVSVYWKQPDGKVQQFQYDIVPDGNAHVTDYNKHPQNITGKVEGNALKVEIASDYHVCKYEVDGDAKKMEINMKAMKDGKWLHFYQAYAL